VSVLIPNTNPGIGFPPPKRDVNAYFPLVTPDCQSDTFEIGLVLGGTVSAGAYTAGVLDFLVQALDAWTSAKDLREPNAPIHNVKIKTLAGTSGGGVNSVLLARALGYAFPHPGQGVAQEDLAKNPLFNVWVNQIDIQGLLKTSDLERSSAISALLCADVIESSAAEAGAYKGGALGTLGTPAIRSYVEQLLPVVLTLTNLRGVPYSSDFRGTTGRSEYYIDRADHVRFLVDITGQHPPDASTLRPFEVGISDAAASTIQPWSTIVRAARGTSAFPIGLPPQTISRNVEHYRYRYLTVETEKNALEAIWQRPAWEYMIPIGADNATPYQFLAVDGGCIDNEPIEFARQHLAGVLGHNARQADKAHRAVILCDPFADKPGVGLLADAGIFNTAGATLSALIGSGRYATADLDLFSDENVYSRFLINPIRGNPAGGVWTAGDAIASSSFAAFMGFMCRAFREHDFLLGRANCQSFLKKHFTLDRNNTLFDGWTPEQKRDYASPDKQFLPVIPLMPSVSADLPIPAWPRSAFHPESIRDALAGRLSKFTELTVSPVLGIQSHTIAWLIAKLLSGLEGKGVDEVIGLIRQSLQKAQLL
jgi:hypothetical protein